MAEPASAVGAADISPWRSWIVRQPIATFLVLVYATTAALVFVPKELTEPGLLPGGAARAAPWRSDTVRGAGERSLLDSERN
jgi:hypothetical protein